MCTQNCLDLSVSNFVAALINLSKLPTPVVSLCTCSAESPVWQQNKTAVKNLSSPILKYVISSSGEHLFILYAN